jgi:hypothetical protein
LRALPRLVKSALPWLIKSAATLCTCRKECNKYDLTAAHCF